MDSRVFGFVHDQIIVDVAPGELFGSFDVVKYSMEEGSVGLKESSWMTVPMVGDFAIGARWEGSLGIVRDGKSLYDGNSFTVNGRRDFLDDFIEVATRGYNIDCQILEDYKVKEELDLEVDSFLSNEKSGMGCKARITITSMAPHTLNM